MDDPRTMQSEWWHESGTNDDGVGYNKVFNHNMNWVKEEISFPCSMFKPIDLIEKKKAAIMTFPT